MHTHDGYKLQVKNTFLEVEPTWDSTCDENEWPALKRVSSGSRISSDSAHPSLDEVRSWINEWKDRGAKSASTEAFSSGQWVPPMLDELQSWMNESKDDGAASASTEESSSSQWVPPKSDSVNLFRQVWKSRLEAKEKGTWVEFEKMLQSMDEAGELRPHVPKDAHGNPLSFGSICHSEVPVGLYCKPCIFYASKRCMLGELCLHCHFYHPEAQQLSKRKNGNANAKPTDANEIKPQAQRRKYWRDRLNGTKPQQGKIVRL